MRILLVEDDAVLGAAVRDQIAGDGHSVDWVTRLDGARDVMASAGYDLILLDLMLPDGRGIVFLKTLRNSGDVTPIIILTALDQVSDRIEGLKAGADDYLVKPFDLDELSARIGSVARRYSATRTLSSGMVRSISTSRGGACSGRASPFSLPRANGHCWRPS
jgi:two-component system OmpR family response regulator